MKKKELKEKHTGISKTSSKFYCKISCTEDLVVDEILIRIKHLPKKAQCSSRRGWLKYFKPSFLLTWLSEIIKTMF